MKRPSNKDYYSILGVPKTASPEEIKEAYRSLSKTHHPDVGGDSEKMKELNEAYSVLSDESQKVEYDNPSFQQPQNPFAGGFHFAGNPFRSGEFDPDDLNEILNNIRGFSFNAGFGQAFSTSIVNHTITVDFIKALTGGEITINLPQIGKTIQFNLPAAGSHPISEYKIRIGGNDRNQVILQLTIVTQLPTNLKPSQIEKLVEILKPLEYHTTEGFRTGSQTL